MKKKERINYIDIARALAIICIVLGHTINHSEHCGLIFKFIYSFHVVLFFIISGYLFNIDKKTKFSSFFKNKFIRIIIPYLLWAILFLVPYMLLGSKVGNEIGTKSSFNLNVQLINVLYGNGNSSALKQNSALWFLPALFTMEIIYYFVIHLINNKPKLKIPMLIILIIIGYATSFLPIYLPWGINTTLNIGVFFYIGYLLKEYKLLEDGSYLQKNYIVLMLGILGIVACFMNKKTVSCIDYKYGVYVLALISGTCLSIFILYISYKIHKNKILEYIGRNTMGILIFHKLIILIFQTKLGYISKLLLDSNLLIEFFIGLIITMLSIISSLVATEILRKIMPVTIGEKRKIKT